MDINNFIQSIAEINTKLESGKEFVDPELLAEFASKYHNLSDNIENIETEERNLRIGIVGAVKAGKSTFLNALLFDGEEVLPKAPTPMTAALTKVCYSDTPSARIVFYSEQEWKKIKEKAETYKSRINELLQKENQEYQQMKARMAGDGGYVSSIKEPTFKSVEAKHKSEMPIEQSSCYELVQMLDKKDISVFNYLKQGEITIEDTSNFNKELNKYVGAKGQYTPIVKYTELSLTNPLLKDLEIVDTPGLNDPILSRSKKTQDFLMQCDVVFVLSYAGQFLTSEDMDLIKNVLPAEGIRHTVIIASKFDSGILDYRKKGGVTTFKEAFSGTRKYIKITAQNQGEQMQKSGISPSIIESLQKNVLGASGLLFSAAKKMENKEPLNEEENHIIHRFQEKYDDFDASVKGLYDLSGMENIRTKVLLSLREEKKKIVLERTETFLFSQQNRFFKLIEDINADLRKNLNDIDQYDYKELQEKSKKLRLNLDSVRKSISAKFENAAVRAEKQMQTIIAEIHEEMENHRDIAVNTKVQTEKDTIRSGLFGMMKQDVTIKKNVLFTGMEEVTKNIEHYCQGAHRIVINQFQSLIDVEGLKKDVKEKVQSVFDMSDQEFDPEEIASTLDQALVKLTVPEISLNSQKYTEKMLTKFPETGSIEGESKIEELKMQQSVVLQEMFGDMKMELSKKASELSKMFYRYAGEFIDDVEWKMTRAIERLQELLTDKKANIQKMNMYMKTVSDCKQILRDMEKDNEYMG